MAGPHLGEGRTAEVFDRGDHVVKLYRPGVPEEVAQREALVLRIVGERGVRGPKFLGLVREEERWGLAMTPLRGPTLGSLLLARRDRRPEVLGAMARVQAGLHGLSGEGLPRQSDRLRQNIELAPGLPSDLRRRLLRRLLDLSGGDRLCHGDFHPFNLVVLPPEEALSDLGVLDWLDATAGVPEADACRTMVLLEEVDEDLAAEWLAIFSVESGLDVRRILLWRPVMAAARLAEGLVGQDAARLRAWAEDP